MNSDPQSPCLTVIQKRLRAQRKKLTRITELEALQASGKELTPEQLPVLRSKPIVLAVLEELQKVEDGLREAAKEEQALAFSRGVAQAQADAAAAASKAAQQHDEKLARELKEQEESLNKTHTEALKRALEKADTEHQDAITALEKTLAASAESETLIAVEAAVAQALEDARKQELSPQHPMKDLITEPVRKLISLLYYSHLFDMQRNPWTARTETFVFLQYEAQQAYPEGQAALTGPELFDLGYFAFSLIDRMNKRVSHQQAIQASVDIALNWILDPAAIAISAPPAPAAITVGELQKRIAQIVASPFSQAVPAAETVAPPALVPSPVPMPAPGFAAPALPAVRPAVAAPPSTIPVPRAKTASSAPAAKADMYPPIAPAGQAGGFVARPPAQPARAAAAPAAPSQPAAGMLPGFLEDTVDNDATTIVTAQANAPAAAPGTALPAKTGAARTGAAATANGQVRPVHQGVYVLSETGVPVSLAPQLQ